MRSKGPPVKPLISPKGTPISNETIADDKPTIKAIRVPQIIRLNTSWPI
jgi:hypothetical protein